MNDEQVADKKVSTVSEYVIQLNKVLASQRGRIKGEVVSIKVVGSAAYYTIKDSDGNAKLDCTTWLNVYQANGIELKVGDEIVVTGAPEFYAPYGRFSFRATSIEYAGEGDLKRAFEKLKAELEAEGLLDESRKRPIPFLPKKIGIITSMSSGVVIHDFMSNLDQHGYKIKTCDSKVEGKEAVLDLLAAVRTMARQDIEILVVIRGGGAIESFQAFNTESVVRAIASFKVPVITGIGHDVDVTLAQLVADIGASTPTAVAETLNAQWDGLESFINDAHSRTLGRFRSALDERSRYIHESRNDISRAYNRQLSSARKIISDASFKSTSLFRRLSQRVRDVNAALQGVMGTMKTTLRTRSLYLSGIPFKLTSALQSDMNAIEKDLTQSGRSLARSQAIAVKAASKQLGNLERAIAGHDPARNIRLGYSLSYVNGKLARHVANIAPGDVVTTKLTDGEFTSAVKEVK